MDPDLFFLLKKFVNAAATPILISLFFLAAGLTLRKKYSRAGWWVVAAGAAILALGSISFLPNLMITPIEHHYPPLLDAGGLPEIRWVVVLAGGHRADAELPVTSELAADTLVRTIEGIRLQRMIPGSGLILSGGSVFQDRPSAELMKELALSLGVDRKDIVLETRSRDTAEQARLLKEHLGERPFVLVTSASHMPRAVFLFSREGMSPLPAPTGHMTSRRYEWSVFDLFPSSRHLRKAETALRETLGLSWESRTANKSFTPSGRDVPGRNDEQTRD